MTIPYPLSQVRLVSACWLLAMLATAWIADALIPLAPGFAVIYEPWLSGLFWGWTALNGLLLVVSVVWPGVAKGD